MVSTRLSLLQPSTWRPVLSATYLLWFGYAHLKSVTTRSCVDASGNPIPWYTYPAIEYLKQLDFSQRTIFEYGSGNSTLFWSGVARRVVSVDDDEKWFEIVSKRLPSNCELTLETDLQAYADTLKRYPDPFDVIVVDGAARGQTRLKCSRLALEHLREGGMIILDNSDWLPESARVLREGGLIQVDMTGFAPITGKTQTTSFFLHRGFNFTPKGSRQPVPGPGAVDMVWERPQSDEPPFVTCGGERFGGVERDESVTFVTPHGPRRFRLIEGHTRRDGLDYAALVDADADRSVIVVSGPLGATPPVGAAIARSMRLPWEDFVTATNAHDKRRFLVKADGSLGGARAVD